MSEAYIIDACRTPRGIGKQGKGSLAHLHPQHLGSTVLKALQERNGFDTADVDDVVWGTSSQVMEQSGDIGRMSALDAGYDMKASGVTLDRFCGSGITSANIAAASVKAGLEDLVVSGGTEMMSLPKKGMLPMGAGNAHLQEIHPQSHQGVCADAIATLEGIDREESDKILDELFDIIEAPDNYYEHVWKAGDLVMWDNLACLHARTDWPDDQKRELRRCTTRGEKLD